MKRLTEIDNKTKNNKPLTKEELVFLYQIDSSIQGFGYQKDPRIEEIRNTRNPKEDAPIVFDCTPDQIASNKEEINKDTKAYIGPLYPNIFQDLEHLEHIYASFPEGKIKKETIEIGGKTKEELQKELKDQNIKISMYAQDMMDNPDFTTAKKTEQADLVRLKVKDLGFDRSATTEEIYNRAEELGLELCPAEVGPQYRLQYIDQPQEEWLYIGMKQVNDSDGNPGVFDLVRGGDGLWLNDRWAQPGRHWNPSLEFVFSIRKLDA